MLLKRVAEIEFAQKGCKSKELDRCSFFDKLQSLSSEYKRFDYSRFPKCFDAIKSYFKIPRAISIIGTNGKGSSGRFLSVCLKNLGFRVGHYTSPHIFKFNERIWIDGRDIYDSELEESYGKIEKILKECNTSFELSYFEYATLVALKSFEGLDFIVLEAGLGGEYDATASIPKDLTLFTPIDIDHTEFLGESLEQIITTKLKGGARDSIIGYQPNLEKVIDISKKIDGIKFHNYLKFLDKIELKKIEDIIKNKNLPSFQIDNLSLVVSALKFLGFKFNSKLVDGFDLIGRSQKIRENILVDVGHNILAAKKIASSSEFRGGVLVFNTLKDKNHIESLKILKESFNRLFILPIESDRAVDCKKLKIDSLELGFEILNELELKNECKYVVFGSFLVVSEFVKSYIKSDNELKIVGICE